MDILTLLAEYLQSIFDFIQKNTVMTDLVTGLITAALIALAGLGLGFLGWMIRRLFISLWEKRQIRRATYKSQVETETKATQKTETPEPSSEKLRVVSYFECPKSGPYRMVEHPQIIQSFIKGQKMSPHHENLFLRTVTWQYIDPEELDESIKDAPQKKTQIKNGKSIIDTEAFNKLMIKSLGYTYGQDIIANVLDDTILENRSHNHVKNRILNILANSEEAFDKSSKNYQDTNIFEIHMDMSTREKREQFAKGFEASLTDYLKTLQLYLQNNRTPRN